ncbi:sugar nucleotide-binding protein [Halosimplex pelagicum]|uniref:Sugar nucleotide-binding protein n=1 Tax=Halosimplex pelagicum TaxID=869886 RepID=A0A7D5SWF7_9EURY|nr:sugar nucleotide-binding protein [Halosimplex pelagicum]QLH83087.1 sugar nucleotide-binding protein [Halosimplex pelagicum]
MTETVLVVGASGYLGRSVAWRLREGADRDERRVLGTYCSEPGPTAEVAFDFWTDDAGELVDEHGVDTVVFAAAVEYGGDADTGESGVGATFAERAERFAAGVSDARVVYVSSASVFDGTGSRYVESDPRSPRDDYGRRLVAFEDAIDARCDDAATVRTSYLFGFSTGRLDRRLARTRDHLDRGESVAYFTDMYKSPVLVTEAAETVAALVDGDATGVVHVPTPRVSVYDFHCEAMAALGHDPGPIERDSIPDDMDVAPDTSLASERFDSLVDFEPSAVGEGLRSQVDADESE